MIDDLGPVSILLGDARQTLKGVAADSVDVICTSPPFYSLRSYLKADDPAKVYELGSEPTPELFLSALMEVFDECKRVLKPTGCVFVEFGDSMGRGTRPLSPNDAKRDQHGLQSEMCYEDSYGSGAIAAAGELMNIPHRFAEAMRSRQWRWRSTMIWEKASPMPESLAGWRWERCKVKLAGCSAPNSGGVRGENLDAAWTSETHPATRAPAVWQPCPGCAKCRATGGLVLRYGQWRPTTGHSYVFMFAKSDRYFCDSTAAAEPASSATIDRNKYTRIIDDPDNQYGIRQALQPGAHEYNCTTRNPRTILRVAGEPMDYDLCLKCGRVWRGAEKKAELRKTAKGYICTCGGKEWASHYACFPRSLVRKLITPAISKGGCCKKCGIPYSPVVETSRTFESGSGKSGNMPIGKNGPDMQGGGETGDIRRGPVVHHAVSGYLPSCTCPCQPAQGVPQTVLDPFAGTCSTGVVAVEMGLNFIGCELNKNYLPLAERRLKEILVPRGRAEAAPGPATPLFQGELP